MDQHMEGQQPESGNNNKWQAVFGEPRDRIEEGRTDTLSKNNLHEHLYLMCRQSMSTRKHIGLEESNATVKKECCSERPCVPWQQPNQQDAVWRDYSLQLAEKMMQRHTEFAYDHHPDLLFCSACHCTMRQYDHSVSSVQQALQSFVLVWNDHVADRKCCAIPDALVRIMCRACFLLWQMCDRNSDVFEYACQLYYRRNGTRLHKIKRVCRYAEHVMDAREIRLKNRSDFQDDKLLPLGLIKSTWLLQLGLVTYPLCQMDMSNATKELVDAYQWAQCRSLTNSTSSVTAPTFSRSRTGRSSRETVYAGRTSIYTLSRTHAVAQLLYSAPTRVYHILDSYQLVAVRRAVQWSGSRA